VPKLQSAEPNLFTRIGGLQLFLVTLVVVTFMLSTVLLEKERTFGALVLSEERYRQFVAHSSEAVWRVELAQPMSMGLLSMEARINWLKQYAHVAECNLSYQQLHKAEGIADSDHSLWRADVPWAAVYLQHLDTAARQGYSMDGLRFTLQTPNGAEVYLTNFSGIVEDGKLLRIWGVARNITEISDLTDRLLASTGSTTFSRPLPEGSVSTAWPIACTPPTAGSALIPHLARAAGSRCTFRSNGRGVSRPKHAIR
jgi:PAS domain-containing protein